MMTIEEITAALKDRRTADVARDTGLAYNTIKNLKTGKGAYSATIEKLSRYLGDNATAEG